MYNPRPTSDSFSIAGIRVRHTAFVGEERCDRVYLVGVTRTYHCSG